MQNLNLYQPAERVASKGPGAPHALVAVALLLVTLAVHGVWQLLQLNALEARVVQAEAAAQQAEDQLSVVSAGFTPPTLDPALPTQVSDEQNGNQRLRRLAGYLGELERQRETGFAGLMQALAERHPPKGLWLTAITLQQGGSDMRLQGFSQSQTLLPSYLDSLARSSALAGREFAQFAVERDDSGLLGFSLDSHAGEVAR